MSTAVLEISENAPSVCLRFSLENSNRLVSLWDIVKLFDAAGLSEMVRELETGHSFLECTRQLVTVFQATPGPLSAAVSQLAAPAKANSTKMALDCMERAQSICAKAGLPKSVAGIASIKQFVATDPVPDLSKLSVEFRHAAEEVIKGLRERAFIAVDDGMATFIDCPGLMGDKVTEAFPSATSDIVSAGNCLACGCDTAAVFHLMRVAEWGLRALAKHLGVNSIRASKKPTNRKYIPLPYSEWERILDDVQEVVDRKISKLKRGPSKQNQQEFYYPVLQDIRGIRDAWRNHVMHTRAEYTHEDAMAIFSHVKRLTQTLSIRVKEF